jgi:hypothetical protein
MAETYRIECEHCRLVTFQKDQAVKPVLVQTPCCKVDVKSTADAKVTAEK